MHDKDGLHTHANLSVANGIFGTKVKANDVHAGKTKTKSRDGGDLTFAISKHHAAALKEDVENINEGETAHAQYLHYHGEAKKMLDKIGKGLDTHAKHISSKDNYNGGQAHWGHVGDMKHFHRQVQDLHDAVLQQGEYAKPPAAIKKEETNLFDCFTDDVRTQVEQVFEQLSDDYKQVIIEMIEAEQYDDIAAIAEEVLNG